MTDQERAEISICRAAGVPYVRHAWTGDARLWTPEDHKLLHEGDQLVFHGDTFNSRWTWGKGGWKEFVDIE